LQAFRQRLSFALMQFIARQLQPAHEVSPNLSLPETPFHGPPLAMGPGPLDRTEQEGWDAPEEEEYFVGPLRLRRRTAT
jgi:hypothetical protein